MFRLVVISIAVELIWKLHMFHCQFAHRFIIKSQVHHCHQEQINKRISDHAQIQLNTIEDFSYRRAFNTKTIDRINSVLSRELLYKSSL
jgi:hypothetical protein